MFRFLNMVRDEIRLRGYSRRTEKTYCSFLKEYFCFVLGCDVHGVVLVDKDAGAVDLARMDEGRIRAFLMGKVNRNLAPQTVNLYLNAIKFFYFEVLRVRGRLNLRFAKFNRRLPVVLSRNEVIIILNNIANIKHRLMVALAYGAGLRISEVTNLKVRDIDFVRMRMFIRMSKGKKDRYVILPDKLKVQLQRLCFGKLPGDFLFESERGGKLHSRSLQKVFIDALRKSGIAKDAHFHSLRHSFATHLLENGTDIRYLQELLGHASIRTTQVYTQVGQGMLDRIKSPL